MLFLNFQLTIQYVCAMCLLQLLVAYGSPLFVENAGKDTPCDCAEKCGHSEIALYLESKMVFSVIIGTFCIFVISICVLE
jgi:hypothetical protein